MEKELPQIEVAPIEVSPIANPEKELTPDEWEENTPAPAPKA